MADKYKTLLIDTIFTYKDNKYKVCVTELQYNTCSLCAFNGVNCDEVKPVRGYCSSYKRKDNLSVYFKLIENNKDMDKVNNVIPTFSTNDSLNDLYIDCPKGYSIDVERSDLSKNIIKFKKDNITLENIYENQGKDTFITNVVSNNKNTYNKISAIAKLMDIANYYNKGWKPDWNNDNEHKYFISYNEKYDSYATNYCLICKDNFIHFRSREDAQDVANNINFRDILDTIYKD